MEEGSAGRSGKADPPPYPSTREGSIYNRLVPTSAEHYTPSPCGRDGEGSAGSVGAPSSPHDLPLLHTLSVGAMPQAQSPGGARSPVPSWCRRSQVPPTLRLQGVPDDGGNRAIKDPPRPSLEGGRVSGERFIHPSVALRHLPCLRGGK